MLSGPASSRLDATGFYFCSMDPKTIDYVKMGTLEQSYSDCDSLWTPDFYNDRSTEDLIHGFAMSLSYRMIIEETSPWAELYRYRLQENKVLMFTSGRRDGNHSFVDEFDSQITLFDPLVENKIG